jgi:hypothetical protein
MPDFIGYAHPQYALSLREFGEPRELPRCGGWILVKPIPGTPYKDAIGCYPIFSCRDWTKLQEDLEHVSSDLVSLTLVTDPFSGVAPDYLEKNFDLVKQFKAHYLADLSYPLERFVNEGHRKNARKSLKIMNVEVCCQPMQYIDKWMSLYNNLISRHNINNISKFSRQYFSVIFNIPGTIMFLGKQKDSIVGGSIVIIRDQVSYAHLSAYAEEGYRIRASYGIKWKSLAYLKEQNIRYLDLGGMAGTKEDPSDGLAQFKRGWSNEQRMVYICGRVFDRKKYDYICQQYQINNNDYFPAYRAVNLIAHIHSKSDE